MMDISRIEHARELHVVASGACCPLRLLPQVTTNAEEMQHDCLFLLCAAAKRQSHFMQCATLSRHVLQQGVSHCCYVLTQCCWD